MDPAGRQMSLATRGVLICAASAPAERIDEIVAHGLRSKEFRSVVSPSDPANSQRAGRVDSVAFAVISRRLEHGAESERRDFVGCAVGLLFLLTATCFMYRIETRGYQAATAPESVEAMMMARTTAEISAKSRSR
jgi:hypothetical protein